MRLFFSAFHIAQNVSKMHRTLKKRLSTQINKKGIVDTMPFAYILNKRFLSVNELLAKFNIRAQCR